jgi:hypothetical protein
MKFLSLLAVPLALISITACDHVEERMEITEQRPLSGYARAPAVSIPSATRFFDDAKEESTEPKQNPLIWATPAGWSEQPASQMRLIDLRFGPAGEGECYLSAMPGGAGGMAANLNRWRTQMGAATPLTDDEIAKLPKKPLLGAASPYLVIDGDFKGVGAEAAKTGYRLLGLIQAAPELTIFVKMTGPKALVEQNTEAFEAFVSSIKFRGRE